MFGRCALVVAGVGWVEALRSSQRAVWLLDQHPGNWLIRRLVDLGMLVGLGLLLGLSLAMTAAIDSAAGLAGARHRRSATLLLRSSGPVLEFVVNLVLAAAMLAAVPRLRLSPRRLIPPTLVVGVGIQLLNTIGGWYIARTREPAGVPAGGRRGRSADLPVPAQPADPVRRGAGRHRAPGARSTSAAGRLGRAGPGAEGAASGRPGAGRCSARRAVAAACAMTSASRTGSGRESRDDGRRRDTLTSDRKVRTWEPS